MLGNAFSGWHLIVILFIILLLFGAPKLPGLAKSLGQSARILKKEVRNDNEQGAETDEEAPTAGPSGAAGPVVPPTSSAATTSAASPSAETDHAAEAARARAEAEAAKRELEELKAQTELRAKQQGDRSE
ncbi:twin-arginine translocase TatA/TatE family subunit [Leucobacter sp. GX24907]